MEKSKMANVIKKLLIGFAVAIAVLFALLFAVGIITIFYTDYKCQRVPIFQTVMTDFEVMQPQEAKDDFHSNSQRDIQKIIDRFEIKTLQCFIFQTHNLRPFYRVYMVGVIPENADYSEYKLEKYPMKKDKRLFNTLKLCGAEPLESEDYLISIDNFMGEADPLESKDYLILIDNFMVGVAIYHNRIILCTGSANPTFLNNDAEKKAYLEQFISQRKK